MALLTTPLGLVVVSRRNGNTASDCAKYWRLSLTKVLQNLNKQDLLYDIESGNRL